MGHAQIELVLDNCEIVIVLDYATAGYQFCIAIPSKSTFCGYFLICQKFWVSHTPQGSARSISCKIYTSPKLLAFAREVHDAKSGLGKPLEWLRHWSHYQCGLWLVSCGVQEHFLFQLPCRCCRYPTLRWWSRYISLYNCVIAGTLGGQ